MTSENNNPAPPAGATVGEWTDHNDRPFTLPATAVEDVTVAIDGSQSRDGFTTSLVALKVNDQVVIGGQPVSIATFMWPGQARQLGQLLIELADQCEHLDATIPY